MTIKKTIKACSEMLKEHQDVCRVCKCTEVEAWTTGTKRVRRNQDGHCGEEIKIIECGKCEKERRIKIKKKVSWMIKVTSTLGLLLFGAQGKPPPKNDSELEQINTNSGEQAPKQIHYIVMVELILHP